MLKNKKIKSKVDPLVLIFCSITFVTNLVTLFTIFHHYKSLVLKISLYQITSNYIKLFTHPQGFLG